MNELRRVFFEGTSKEEGVSKGKLLLLSNWIVLLSTKYYKVPLHLLLDI